MAWLKHEYSRKEDVENIECHVAFSMYVSLGEVSEPKRVNYLELSTNYAVRTQYQDKVETWPCSVHGNSTYFSYDCPQTLIDSQILRS